MLTLRELADEFNMTPTELRELFPWSFDPRTPDNEPVTAEAEWDVRAAFTPMPTAYLGD